jgi:ribosomal protein L11 methyltransferase
MVLAVVDDFVPTAVDDLASGDAIRVFFTSSEHRDEAAAAVRASFSTARVTTVDVDDEDWARRSQQDLTPITVGRITVTPPWFAGSPDLRPPASLRIVITPSMGFGTGHHATTRLCLKALQEIDLTGARVLDVGTGSGVLAIAASLLGAREVVAIDSDPDALACARENLSDNAPAVVSFDVADLRTAPLDPADLVLANLTGAVLVHNAERLAALVVAGGNLVVSGLQSHERDEVIAAFRHASLAWSDEEMGWVALRFNFPAGGAV